MAFSLSDSKNNDIFRFENLHITVFYMSRIMNCSTSKIMNTTSEIPLHSQAVLNIAYLQRNFPLFANVAKVNIFVVCVERRNRLKRDSKCNKYWCERMRRYLRYVVAKNFISALSAIFFVCSPFHFSICRHSMVSRVTELIEAYNLFLNK